MGNGKSCNDCPHGRNCINGRWCSVKKIYVEHSTNIRCDYDNN